MLQYIPTILITALGAPLLIRLWVVVFGQVDITNDGRPVFFKHMRWVTKLVGPRNAVFISM